MQEFGEALAVRQPVLSSDTLGWSKIHMSQWYSPQQAFATSEVSKHLLCVHCTSYYENYYTMHIIPSHEPVLSLWEKASLYFLKVEIDPSFADELARASGMARGQRLRLERRFHLRDPKLLQLGLWMFEELQSGGAKGMIYSESLANMLVIHLLQNYAKPETEHIASQPLGSREIDQAIHYMRENLETDLSLMELSSAANMSLSHFIRLFKQHTGHPPHHYLIRLRIERAKFLIRAGKIGLKEIAVQLGFADQGHFTRAFKRITGTTPMQYALDSHASSIASSR